MSATEPALDLAQAARTLASRAADEAADAERARRLKPELVTAIAEAGLFRMLTPRAVGGLEVEPAVMVDAVETLAAGDGAAAWCVAVSSTSGMLGAYLPAEDARAVFGDPLAIAGGVFAPKGRAVPVDGGYRAQGRWSFASGCEHCDWLMGGCLIEENGDVRKLPSGAPDIRLLLFPAADVRIHDTWRVAGLRATGSHDMEVADREVPAGRSASLLSDRPAEGGALYAFPVFGTLAISIGAVALGIARAALDELAELAGGRTPTGSRRTLAQRGDTQVRAARARAALGSARAYVDAAVGAAWEAAQATGDVPLPARTELRLAASHATGTAAAAVDTAWELCGGAAIYEGSGLERRFRDVHVAGQHMLVGPGSWELAGRMVLGLPTDPAQL